MLLIGGATKTLESEETQEVFVNWALRIVYNDKIKDGLLDNMVWSPIKNFFSFGYGGEAKPE